MNFFKSLSQKISDPNTKSVVSNIVLSFGVKGISIFVTLFTTPAYIRYFNNDEVLGVWFTVLSVLTWVLNCDFGVGHGLRNKLAELFTKNEEEKAKKYISSVYAFLAIVSAFVITIISIFSKFINWNTIFNIGNTSLSSAELTETIMILLSGICFQLFFQLITSILYAYQKAFVPGLLNLITSFSMLVFAIVSCELGINGSIKMMALAHSIAINAPLLVASVILFCGKLKNVRPSIKCCKRNYATETLKVGGVFLWLQFMALLLNATDSYLITTFVGNSEVVEYQLYYRWFHLASTLILLVVTPIWSAATKAQTEGNFVWLNKLFNKISAIGVLFIVSQFGLVLLLQIVFDIWLGDESIKVNYLNAIIFAFYGIVLIWSNVITNFVNGLGKLKIQTFLLPVAIVIKMFSIFIMIKFEKNYIVIVASNVLAYLPYLVVQTLWLKKYLKKKIVKNQN